MTPRNGRILLILGLALSCSPAKDTDLIDAPDVALQKDANLTVVPNVALQRDTSVDDGRTPPLPSSLVITELMVHPAGPEEARHQWLEIANTGSEAIQSGQWSVIVEETGLEPAVFPLKAGLSISPGQAIAFGGDNLDPDNWACGEHCPLPLEGGVVHLQLGDQITNSVAYGNVNAPNVPHAPAPVTGHSLALMQHCSDSNCTTDLVVPEWVSFELDGNQNAYCLPPDCLELGKGDATWDGIYDEYGNEGTPASPNPWVRFSTQEECGDSICSIGESKCNCPEDCGSPCDGKECGPDPLCGGHCGACGGSGTCVDGHCAQLCTPDCEDLECGDDPACGESCGDCEDGYTCSSGKCIQDCTQVCKDKECGEYLGCDCGVDHCSSLDNVAVGFCVGGLCATPECKPGYKDCNAISSDGCEFVVKPEECDGLDNDCDGLVDNEAPRVIGKVCKNGECLVPSDCDLDSICCTPDGSFVPFGENGNGCTSDCKYCNGSGSCKNEPNGKPCSIMGDTCQDGWCVEQCEPNCQEKCPGASNGCGGTCSNNDCSGCCEGFSCMQGNSDNSCGKWGAPCDACWWDEKCQNGQCAPDCEQICQGKECGEDPDCDCWECPPSEQCENFKCIECCQVEPLDPSMGQWTGNFPQGLSCEDPFCTENPFSAGCGVLFRGRVVDIDGNLATLQFKKAELGTAPTNSIKYWIVEGAGPLASCSNLEFFPVRATGTWPDSVATLTVDDVPIFSNNQECENSDDGESQALFIITGSGDPFPFGSDEKVYFQKKPVELIKECD